jgi:hypothetical protein
MATIEEIIEEVRLAEESNPAPAKKKKPAAKTNGHTTLSADEQLAMSAGRIVAALGLAAKGVTVDILLAQVRAFEQPYTGVVQ